MEMFTLFLIISVFSTATSVSKQCLPEFDEAMHLGLIKSCFNNLERCQGGLPFAVNTSKNHCNPDPCDRGTCFNGTSRYLCNCSYGYAGQNCSKFDSNITEPLLTINGTHYRLTKRKDSVHSWSDSREECKKIGGDLAAAGLRNDTIRKKVYESLKKIWKTSPFIGLTKSKADDTWYWTDGVKAWLNSSFWAENRPRSYKNHTCAVLHRNLTGNITDRNCTKNNVPGLCAFDILHFPIKTDL